MKPEDARPGVEVIVRSRPLVGALDGREYRFRPFRAKVLNGGVPEKNRGHGVFVMRDDRQRGMSQFCTWDELTLAKKDRDHEALERRIEYAREQRSEAGRKAWATRQGK